MLIISRSSAVPTGLKLGSQIRRPLSLNFTSVNEILYRGWASIAPDDMITRPHRRRYRVPSPRLDACRFAMMGKLRRHLVLQMLPSNVISPNRFGPSDTTLSSWMIRCFVKLMLMQLVKRSLLGLGRKIIRQPDLMVLQVLSPISSTVCVCTFSTAFSHCVMRIHPAVVPCCLRLC